MMLTRSIGSRSGFVSSIVACPAVTASSIVVVVISRLSFFLEVELDCQIDARFDWVFGSDAALGLG
jgi:hypothetical protein